MHMRKQIRCVMGIVLLGLFLGACGKTDGDKQVSLRVWGSQEEEKCLTQMVKEFEEHYKNEADLDIQVGVQNAGDFKTNYLKNVESGADVFEFPNDQLCELVEADSLLPITWEKEETIAENGGYATAIQSATCNDRLYAYPMTASNGYFLFYNKKYFSEDDVQSMDQILRVAEKQGKKVYMDWTSGWYIYSFFAGAGFEVRLADNHLANICNWNEQTGGIKGTDVAEAMLAISDQKSFLSGDNDIFCEGIETGEIIAGVSGMWNEKQVSKAYGSDYAATKLPTYTLRGEQVQMKSFSGYRLIGVNATTSEPEWAQRLARWITNEKNQMLRFQMTGKGPSNVAAAESESVKKAPAIQALQKQEPYSVIQNVGENFWSAATAFGAIMESGNKDGLDLQRVLDELVREAERPIGTGK